MSMNILEIENLNAFFSGKQVLHDVSLTVQTGRKLALVGESGSGKTVLAQGIMRLNPLVSFEGPWIRISSATLWYQWLEQIQE